jgi:succinyl-diaminopimelate desuccinylase
VPVKETTARVVEEVDPAEVLSFVSELISCPTVESVEPIVPLLTKRMKGAGMDIEVYEIPDPRHPGTVQPVVMGTLTGQKEKPLLCFNGHTDVVPVEFPEKWSSPPFDPVVRQGRLFGRGAVDMKGGLGAMVLAAEAVTRAGLALEGTLVIAAVPGEESGGWGTESMVAKGNWDAAVIGEPTDLAVCPACNGITTFWIEISGRSAHASMPEKGINAIDKMAKVLVAFEGYRKVLQRRAHPLTGTPAFVNCIIDGGWRSVIVADRCRLHVTTHLVPGETAKQRLQEVRDILEGLKEADPEIDYRILDWKDQPLALPILSSGPDRPKLDPTEISKDEPIVQTLLRASQDVRGTQSPLGGTRYACDSPFFVNDYGVPTVACGPGSIDQAHTYDEWVEVDQLVLAARLYAVTAADFLGAT